MSYVLFASTFEAVPASFGIDHSHGAALVQADFSRGEDRASAGLAYSTGAGRERRKQANRPMFPTSSIRNLEKGRRAPGTILLMPISDLCARMMSFGQH